MDNFTMDSTARVGAVLRHIQEAATSSLTHGLESDWPPTAMIGVALLFIILGHLFTRSDLFRAVLRGNDGGRLNAKDLVPAMTVSQVRRSPIEQESSL